MNLSWNKTVLPIAAIFSFRMLGLFMLIPVFTLYARDLQGATPALIGLALGGYGLSQGLLQIPFGLLSDRIGRKPMIALGLILFALGSLIGAVTDSIYGMILARAIQGTGAVGSVLMALLADLTPDEKRTHSMAIIGMTIGISFGLAMIFSPIVSRYFGLTGIFYFSSMLVLLGLLLLYLVIPACSHERFHPDSAADTSLLFTVMKNKRLLNLDWGIFCQHFILTATFFEMPLLLHHYQSDGQFSQQWQFYLPIMLFSFIAMMPFIILAERKKRLQSFFIAAVSIIGLSQFLLMYGYHHWWLVCLLMFLYFCAFNFLEASLPSLISKQAASGTKGTAMGVYSSCQFLGIFVGGSSAGLIYQKLGFQGIFLVNALLAIAWFAVALSIFKNNKAPHYSNIADKATHP